jgi:hypothetical protein
MLQSCIPKDAQLGIPQKKEEAVCEVTSLYVMRRRGRDNETSIDIQSEMYGNKKLRLADARLLATLQSTVEDAMHHALAK